MARPGRRAGQRPSRHRWPLGGGIRADAMIPRCVTWAECAASKSHSRSSSSAESAQLPLRPVLDLAYLALCLFSHHTVQYPCPHAHARAHTIMRYTVLPSHDVTCKCNAGACSVQSPWHLLCTILACDVSLSDTRLRRILRCCRSSSAVPPSSSVYDPFGMT